MKPIVPLALLLTAATSVQAQSVLDLQPGPSNAVEGIVSSPFSSSPAGTTSVNYVAAYWTGNGTPGAWRTFLKFDYTNLPANAIIDSAVMSLYADKASAFGAAAAPTHGTDNSGALYRVTAAWNPATMTWLNQPTFTNLNGTVVPQAMSDTQSYPRIVVTDVVKDQIQYGNHGFVLKLLQETFYYNSLIFHSSRSTNAAARPRLRIYYHLPSSVASVAADYGKCIVSPNPASQYTQLLIPSSLNVGGCSIRLIDMTGRTMLIQELGQPNERINVASLPRGIYQLTITKNNQRVAVYPLVLQ